MTKARAAVLTVAVGVLATAACEGGTSQSGPPPSEVGATGVFSTGEPPAPLTTEQPAAPNPPRNTTTPTTAEQPPPVTTTSGSPTTTTSGPTTTTTSSPTSTTGPSEEPCIAIYPPPPGCE